MNIFGCQSVREGTFFISYGIFLSLSIISTSFFAISISNSYFTLMYFFCLMLLVAGELYSIKITFYQFVCVIFIAFLAINSYIVNQTNVFLLLLAYVYAAHDIKIERILKFSLILSIVFLTFVVSSALSGVILRYNEVNIILGMVRERDYLGFSYALFPQAILANISNIVVYFLYKYPLKQFLLGLAFIFVVNYVMFIYTDARLSFFLTFITMIFLSVLRFSCTFAENILIKQIIKKSFILASVLALYIVISYNPDNVYEFFINLLLEGRISMAQEAWNQYGVSIFGHHIEWSGAGLDKDGLNSPLAYFYVDCIYVKMLVENGIFMLLAYIWINTKVLSRFLKEKNYQMGVILAVIAVHGILDDLIFQIHYNSFILAVGSKFFSREE